MDRMQKHRHGSLLWGEANTTADFEQAAGYYLRFIEEYPESEDYEKGAYYLSYCYYRLDRPEEAAAILAETVEIRRRVSGPDHPKTLRAMSNLATVLYTLERFEENEALNREVLEGQRRVLGPDHRATLTTQNNIVVLYRTQGRVDEAEALALETLEAQRRVFGEDHPDTIRSVYNLSLIYGIREDWEASERYLLQAIDARKRVLGETHRTTQATVYAHACLLARQGERQRAVAVLRELVDQGWAKERLFEDPDLDALRGDQEFEAIVAEVRNKLDGES